MKRRQLDAVAQRREELKRELRRIKEDHPESKVRKFVRDQPGRPTLEENQPELLNAIKEIACHISAADDRRRSEAIRSCVSLDQLHEKLQDQGFALSRAGTYLRLIPKRWNTYEGKRPLHPLKSY